MTARSRNRGLSQSEGISATVSHHAGMFDKFADRVATVTARAWFFAACIALVAVWLPSFIVVRSFDTWQLLINTPTTVVTFLLVGLSQNTAARQDTANQLKLNAIAAGLVLLLKVLGHEDSRQAQQLREAVGLEDEVGS